MYDGNGTKTAKQIGLKMYHSDGTVISSDYGNANGLYERPFTFVASSSGTVAVTAACRTRYYGWENGTGTYAIKYTSRPGYYTLSEGRWKDDEILTDGQVNRYVINVISGMQYSIYLNDMYDGNDTKTAERIGLKIYHSNDTVICNNYRDACKLYENPYTFTAESDGTVFITAASCWLNNWERGIGTYAIKYKENFNYEESEYSR